MCLVAARESAMPLEFAPGQRENRIRAIVGGAVWRKSFAKRGSIGLGGAFLAQVLGETGFQEFRSGVFLHKSFAKRGSKGLGEAFFAQVPGETGF